MIASESTQHTLSTEGSAGVAFEDAERNVSLLEPLCQCQPAKTGADDTGHCYGTSGPVWREKKYMFRGVHFPYIPAIPDHALTLRSVHSCNFALKTDGLLHDTFLAMLSDA